MILRPQFRLMKPLHHHHDPAQSEVLAHICFVLGCDLARAEKSFNSMRNIKSRVLLFDGQSRTWRGCDWVPDDKDSAIRELQFQIVKIQSDIRYIKRILGNKIKKKSKSKLKEELAYLSCPCGCKGFDETESNGIYKCKVCSKTISNDNNLKLYNLWNVSGNKIINSDNI